MRISSSQLTIPKTPNCFASTATWIREQEKKGTCHKVLVYVLVFFASVFLAATLIGIWPLLKCYKEYVLQNESLKTQKLIQTLTQKHTNQVKALENSHALEQRARLKRYAETVDQLVTEKEKSQNSAEIANLNFKKLENTVTFLEGSNASLKEELNSALKTLEIERFKTHADTKFLKKQIRKLKSKSVQTL